MTNHLKQKQQKQQKQQKSLLSVLELFVGNKNGLTCIFLFLLFNSLPYVAADGDTHSPPPIYGLAANFNPSMGIILVVFISAFFFMGFFSIYIRQCSQTRGSINPDGVHGGASRRGNRGLDAAVIETFPTFPYSYVKDHKLGKGALECAVCLTEFEDADKIRLLPKCDHAFHPDCIDVWFSKRTTCPVCRANFAPVQDETPTTISPVRDIETGDPDLEIPLSDPANEQHSVHGTDEEPLVVPVAPDVINQISMQKRPVRSGSTKPRFTGRFPRSHSTGHSLVQPGEDLERFTLRLPEDVRKQIMNTSHLNRTSVHLNRTRSMMVIFPRLGSSRKGYRTTGEGSSRGRRSVATGEGSSRGRKPEGWVLSITPPFFARAASSSSSGSPKITTEPFTSVTPRAGSLRSPLGARTNPDGTELSSTRPPI